MEKLPVEAIDLIATHIQERRCRWDRWEWNPKWHPEWTTTNHDWRKDIASLRLVNAHLASSLQHILFEDIEVNLYFAAKAGSKRLGNLLHLSQSRLAGHVKSLVITLGDTYWYPGLDEGEPRDSWGNTLVFFEDLTQCLPLCVQAMHNLRSLNMICRSSRYEDETEELIPHEHCQQVDTMMTVILTHTNLDRLVDLTIRVPCTHDIHTIMEHDRDREYSACQRRLARSLSSLRSLTLKICDDSGPHGQSYYDKEPSELLQKFGPQERYAQSFFDFAGMSTQLESLTITCTVPLNFDLFATSKLQRLKSLCLRRVKISGEHLLRLLDQNGTSLEAIWFIQVGLLSKTWEDVLVRCCRLPSLMHILMCTSGYAEDADEFIVDGLFIDSYDLKSIEGSFRDACALRELTRLVNLRRQKHNIPEYTWVDEESIDLPPLADLALESTELDGSEIEEPEPEESEPEESEPEESELDE